MIRRGRRSDQQLRQKWMNHYQAMKMKEKIENRIRTALILLAALFVSLLVLSVQAMADQAYSTDKMSGLYSGAWVQTSYGFSYYEPVSGFDDMRGSEAAVMSDAVYYRYNRALDLFVLIYRGFQDYAPTLEGIRDYVTGSGSTGITQANCNGIEAVQFENQTRHSKEFNIAFPDPYGAIIQVTIRCPDDNTRYAFGREVFSSVIPNDTANTYLASKGEDLVGRVYHISDFGGLYQGTWVPLLDFFRFCGPSDPGWNNLTGTEEAVSCDAIALYRNESLGMVFIIYYGFQPYDTTEGIFETVAGRPECLNLHYARCNGLKVVEFEKAERDRSIAFADNRGGIVQVTVQCEDPVLRNQYAEQLFSSLAPIEAHTESGESIPQEYRSLLSQPFIASGDEMIDQRGSQYALHDADSDGISELLVRYQEAGSADGLSDIYVYSISEGQGRYAGRLVCSDALEAAGASSKGYYYDMRHDYGHTSFSWNVYRITDASMVPAATFRIEPDPGNPILQSLYVNDRIVTADEFNSNFSLFLDGEMVLGEDGLTTWSGHNGFSFTENIYVGAFPD